MLFLFCSFFLAFAKPSLEIPKLSKQAKQNFILENVKFNYNGTIYKIFIAKNKNENSNYKYKIIYLLDGNAFFPLFLNLFNTPVKENLLIIGIGYDNNLAFDTQKRTKDYTPTTNLNKQGGGSKEFRNFLITQLIPYINKMYPIDFSHQILFGHSFEGLFAIDTLLYDSKIFSHYFIISPSLWWDNSEFLPNIIKLQTCPKIYIGLGSLETNSSIIKGVAKLNAQKLSEKISKETNCKTHFKLFKNETHGSVISKAMLWMKKLLDLN
ncbi:TPA: alpha/beta hydrolase [Campylobacter jejuni]|nr:alpha/beta hydrolase [Campylobacter jejuni]